METETRHLRGECYCGAIAYEVVDAFEYALICHCSGCRRATGSAAKPFGGIAASQLKIVKGGHIIRRFGAGVNHNANCSECGSLLYSLVRAGEYVHVTLGTLVDEPSIRPHGHIFVGSKAAWEEILDDLPRFDALPTTEA